MTLSERFEREARGEIVTHPLPWGYLDYLTYCLRPGTVTVIAGPTGVGKSYLLMETDIFLHRRGVDTCYLPLEDDRIDWERRALCIMDGSFSHNMMDQDRAPARMEAYARHEQELKDVMSRVSENPRMIKNFDYKVDHKFVEEWCEASSRVSKVVFIDPYAQIEVDGAKPWELESKFARRMCAIAKKHEIAVVLAMHTKCRPGKSSDMPLTVDDIQGSTNLCRLFHSVLILNQYGEDKSGEVALYGGGVTKAVWNASMYIAKARNSSGIRKSVAFNFKGIPTFEEVGLIIPKNKASKKKNGNE